MFNRSGLRSVIDGHPGRRARTKAAFTHDDVFASMFGGDLCGGDCIKDVMDIKPFWDNRENIRVCSSDVIQRMPVTNEGPDAGTCSASTPDDESILNLSAEAAEHETG